MEEEKSHVEVLIEKTGDYTRKKVELYKLKAVDKAADIVSTIAADVTIISIIIHPISVDICTEGYFEVLIVAGLLHNTVEVTNLKKI